MTTEISRPLTEVYKAFQNLEKEFIIKDKLDKESVEKNSIKIDDISFKDLKSSLKKLEKFKNFDKNTDWAWSNTYHFYDKIETLEDLQRILLLRYINRILRKLLTSFENLLLKIQSNGENKEGLLPTFKQLNKILNIKFDSKISLAVFYELLIEEESNQKHFSFGDIIMIEVWQNISNNIYDKRFLNWIIRYKSLLENYIVNETNDKIKERLKNSQYTERKSFSYGKLVNIAKNLTNDFF